MPVISREEIHAILRLWRSVAVPQAGATCRPGQRNDGGSDRANAALSFDRGNHVASSQFYPAADELHANCTHAADDPLEDWTMFLLERTDPKA